MEGALAGGADWPYISVDECDVDMNRNIARVMQENGGELRLLAVMSPGLLHGAASLDGVG